MDSEHRRTTERSRKLVRANLIANHDRQKAEFERVFPASGIRLPPPREVRPARVSRAEIDRWNELGGRGLRMAREELRRDIRGQRRSFVEFMRGGHARRQVIGTNTTIFDCDLTASGFFAGSGASMGGGGSLAALTSITTVQATARNAARFIAIAASGEPFGSADVDVVVTGNFAFTVGVNAMATVTAFGEALGSYVLNAPQRNPWYPWASPPSCGVYLNSTIQGFITGPAPRFRTVKLPFTVGADQAHLDVVGFPGSVTKTGLLQNAPVATSWVQPSVSVSAGSIVSVAVSVHIMVWALFGGSAFVDCLSGSGSGLNIPAVSLRLDF
jgi:hypothetical protein